MDLDFFARRLDEWIDRHSAFVGDFLGDSAVDELYAARNAVGTCLDLADPDQGFECYGEAWQFFHDIFEDAHVERRRRRREAQKKQREERKRRELQKRRQQEQRRQKEMQRNVMGRVKVVHLWAG